MATTPTHPSDTAPGSPADIAALAARHGLTIETDSIRLNEAGLDYRVAYGRTDDGEDWVLRIPRRDMAESIEAEAAVLQVAGAHLVGVAVPDWLVAHAELIAYPLLPGSPAMTLDDDGAPVHHVDVASRRYAAELGRLLAAIHGIGTEHLAAAGLQPTTAAHARDERRGDLAQVAAAFTIPQELLQRWHTWLDTDSYWPAWTVFTHGEPYQAHVLVDSADHITGVLDWTTAAIGDPATDFAFQHMSAPPEVFDLTVHAYAKAGGRTWPRLTEHCTELMSFWPVNYGKYALTTGSEEHTAAAQAMLNPPAGA